MIPLPHLHYIYAVFTALPLHDLHAAFTCAWLSAEIVSGANKCLKSGAKYEPPKKLKYFQPVGQKNGPKLPP
jgi:hypothetical protein